MRDHEDRNVVTQSSATAEQMQINPYETDPLINMYCSFDFGERINCLGTMFPQFPVVQAILCEQIMKKSKYWAGYQSGEVKMRAVDIGCAVGRTSYELTQIGRAHV